jgi:hypothetical protein
MTLSAHERSSARMAGQHTVAEFLARYFSDKGILGDSEAFAADAAHRHPWPPSSGDGDRAKLPQAGGKREFLFGINGVDLVYVLRDVYPPRIISHGAIISC